MKKLFYGLVTLSLLSMVLFSCSKIVKSDAGETKVEESKMEESKVEETSEKNIYDANEEQVLKNTIFEIGMPNELKGTYITRVLPENDNAQDFIEIYDVESRKNKNNGLVFAICAYKNPEDWAGGPFEKVGELTTNDNETYDILIGYPTESQWGFSDDPSKLLEMPDVYKKIYDKRFDVAKTVKGLKGEKIDYEAGCKGGLLYGEVLDKHTKAINEKWDATKLEDENMSSMYYEISTEEEKPFEKIGYAYCDVNVDGIDELLIGENADGDWKGVVYDIYTMVDRKPAHVVSGWDRNRYFVSNNGFICNEYSSGADESGYIISAISSNSKDLNFQMAIKYDGYTNEKNPWFIAYNKVGEDDYQYEETTEEDYNEKVERFSNYIRFDFEDFAKR